MRTCRARFAKEHIENLAESAAPEAVREPAEVTKPTGSHAIADIYVFSETEWATADSLLTLARGPHGPPAPAKKGGRTFAETIGLVRGHYVINLHEAEHRDRASIGYADEDGQVHGPNYRELF